MDYILPSKIDEIYINKDMSFTTMYNNCCNVYKFIIYNLYKLKNNYINFIYIIDFNLTEHQLDLLFKINQSAKLITLNMFVERSNKDNIYLKKALQYNNYDDSPVFSMYNKKYISAFIHNDEIEKLLNKVKTYNDNRFNKYKLKVYLEDYIKKARVKTNKLENSEIEDIIPESQYRNKLNLKYLDKNMHKYKDIFSIYAYSNLNYYTMNNIKTIFDDFTQLHPSLVSEIKENYTEFLIYEDAFETKTNLVDILYNFIM
jgi:hypothetical protein